MPFGSLVKAQQSLQPPSDRAPSLKRKRETEVVRKDKRTKKGTGHRENKNAPAEMSSKKPVSRSREVVDVVKVERRDPRFDPHNHDNLGEKINKRRYAFLKDYRQDEMRLLQANLKKEKDSIARAELEKTLRSMQSKEQASAERERRQKVLSDFKHKEREAAKIGKTPYHLKESAKNELYLKDKFESMKSSKVVDRYMEKKRKKRSQKDRKRVLPSR